MDETSSAKFNTRMTYSSGSALSPAVLNIGYQPTSEASSDWLRILRVYNLANSGRLSMIGDSLLLVSVWHRSDAQNIWQFLIPLGSEFATYKMGYPRMWKQEDSTFAYQDAEISLCLAAVKERKFVYDLRASFDSGAVLCTDLYFLNVYEVEVVEHDKDAVVFAVQWKGSDQPKRIRYSLTDNGVTMEDQP